MRQRSLRGAALLPTTVCDAAPAAALTEVSLVEFSTDCVIRRVQSLILLVGCSSGVSRSYNYTIKRLINQF